MEARTVTAQAIACKIQKKENNDKFVFFCNIHHTRVYYAIQPEFPNIPYSAMTVLIQGLYNIYYPNKDIGRGTGFLCIPNRDAFLQDKFSRGMIDFCFKSGQQYSNIDVEMGFPIDADDSEIDIEIVKINPDDLINRRSLDTFMTGLPSRRPIPPIDLTNEQKNNTHSGGHTLHRLYMMAAYTILTRYTPGEPIPPQQTKQGHNIAALLVSQEGEILAWAYNTMSINHTYHAEVNLLQSYFKRTQEKKLPSNVRIYTTLKPCTMCAGMIVHYAAGQNFKVIYGQDDLGNHAKTTVLDQDFPNNQMLLSGSNNRLPIRIRDIKTDQVLHNNMSAILHAKSIQAKAQSEMPLTTFLNTPAKELMYGAEHSLVRKFNKYLQQDFHLNPNVAAVLDTLYSFLVELGMVSVVEQE